MITLLTIAMTWVFNNAEGSLLITMLMHASFNTFANKVVAPLFPAPLLNDYGLLPELVGFGAVAVIVVAPTRGRLSLHDKRRSQKSIRPPCRAKTSRLYQRSGDIPQSWPDTS